MQQFLIKNLIFSVIIAIGSFCIRQFTGLIMPFPETWFIIVFFFIINSLSYWLMLKSIGERAALLVQQFMKSMLIKFFSIIGSIAVYSYVNKKGLKPFVITLLAFYFIFLIFEVIALMKLLKTDNHEPE
ncbi:MAG: hypothetical protein HRT72_10800 [Flavobacteriales bacterium]|nr:hypothetical protein [Flavobacteriales bacterium]